MPSRKWLRIILPLALIAIWFGLAGIGGPTFGKLSEVTTNDQASFLPASAESTKVQKLQKDFNDGTAIPAVLVVESKDKLGPKEVKAYAALANKLSNVKGLQQAENTERGLVIGPIPSKDGYAVEFIALIDTSYELKDVVQELQATADKSVPTNARAYVTGPAGLSADLVKAFGGIDGILLLVALSAVFIILLIVYRSVLLPFIVLMTSLFALCAAILVVYWLAKKGIIELNGQSQGILSILVIGAATDYSLLFIARYREALEALASKWSALQLAVKSSFEPILASAATVALALLCLLFSDLNSNKSLGPIAATGIAFSFLATLTFLPALLVVFGRTAFWPTKIKLIKSKNKKPKIINGKEELKGVWSKVGRIISLHPRRVWVATVAALLVCSLGLLQLKANGVAQTDIILVQSNAVDGQAVLARHFSAGSGAPVVVIAPQSSLAAALSIIKNSPGISDATVFSGPTRTAASAGPKVVNDNVLINATLKSTPYSSQAEATVRSLRQNLSALNNESLVGGTTAINLDTNDTAKRDLKLIIPIVLCVILVILIGLLRSVLAPLLLIGTVVLSFAATLGISALVFNHLLGFPGADPAVPLFGFIFLVALGVDYNIFLMTRAREEAFRYGTKPAMLHSLGKTGGVITSAGIVLAATFASLGIIPILFLVQLAFIVAFGVLLDTTIVRSLLVPALVYDFGAKVWWPSKKLNK